ncbi:MAG TPA: hypothetical protein VGM20_09930 [Gemmatimonadales bacterium]
MRVRQLVMVGVMVALPLVSLSAQRFWRTADDEGMVALDVAKPFFKSGSDISFGSIAVIASGRFPVNQKVSITVGIPYATISYRHDDGFDQPGSTAIGNPWIGADVVAAPSVVFEGGLRPGISSGDLSHFDATALGVFADFQRFEEWAPKTTSARAMLHLGNVPEHGTFVSGLVGGTYIFSSRGSDAQIYANYAVRLGVAESGILTSLIGSGLTYLGSNGAGGSLGDKTDLQLAVRVEGSNGRLRPFAELGTFTQESIRDDVKAIVTIGASVKY